MLARPNVYRLVVEGAGPERIELCMEFSDSRNSPVVSVWAEKFVPGRWDMDEGVFTQDEFRATRRQYVYGTEFLQRKNTSLPDMVTYQVADALCREAVVGREAGSLAHAVLAQWFIRGPRHLMKEIAELAPDWWRLVQPPKGRSKG